MLCYFLFYVSRILWWRAHPPTRYGQTRVIQSNKAQDGALWLTVGRARKPSYTHSNTFHNKTRTYEKPHKVYCTPTNTHQQQKQQQQKHGHLFCLTVPCLNQIYDVCGVGGEGSTCGGGAPVWHNLGTHARLRGRRM